MAIIELGRDTVESPLEPGTDQFPEPAVTEPAALTDRLSGGWALFLTAAWVTIFTTGAALEPAPTNGHAMPLLAALLAGALMLGWMVMAAGFAQRRRYGAAGSLGAAGVLVAMTIACPLSGHHAGIGAWWWFELAGSLALVAASEAALRA